MFDLPADLVDWTVPRFNAVPLRREICRRRLDNEQLRRMTGLGESTMEKVRSCKHRIHERTITRVMEALASRPPMQDFAPLEEAV